VPVIHTELPAVALTWPAEPSARHFTGSFGDSISGPAGPKMLSPS